MQIDKPTREQVLNAWADYDLDWQLRRDAAVMGAVKEDFPPKPAAPPWPRDYLIDEIDTVRPTKIHEAEFGDTIAMQDKPEEVPAPPRPTSQCHLMIDLETFGTQAGSVILAIGAVKFYPNEPGGPVFGEQFYAAIDPRSCAQLGLQLDMATLLWWLEPAQRAALDFWLAQKNSWQDIANALEGFHQWVGDDAGPTWARGPSFDCVILRTAYRCVGRETPWHFRYDRDQRSILGLMPSDWVPEFVGGNPPGHWHDALADAIRQTNALLQVAKAKGLVLS